jgi:hypothetical protein
MAMVCGRPALGGDAPLHCLAGELEDGHQGDAVHHRAPPERWRALGQLIAGDDAMEGIDALVMPPYSSGKPI